jgi:DNA-binding transcriptional LysR family regulator
MDLNKLVYFITVAEKQNITHAAEELHMTQPPLSRAMKELEEELGVTLFIRGKRKFALTEEGRYFLEQANNILKVADHTKAHLHEMHDELLSGKLRLGTTESAAGEILPGIISRMRELYPKARFEVYCGNSTDICSRLRSGLIDVAFVRSPYDQSDFVSNYVGRQKLIAFTGTGHKFADRDSVSVEELAEEPLILPSRSGLRSEILNRFAGWEQKIDILVEYNQITSIWPLVAMNIGCAICPEADRLLMNDRKLHFMDIDGVSRDSELFVIHLRNSELTPLARAFTELAQKP